MAIWKVLTGDSFDASYYSVASKTFCRQEFRKFICWPRIAARQIYLSITYTQQLLMNKDNGYVQQRGSKNSGSIITYILLLTRFLSLCFLLSYSMCNIFHIFCCCCCFFLIQINSVPAHKPEVAIYCLGKSIFPPRHLTTIRKYMNPNHYCYVRLVTLQEQRDSGGSGWIKRQQQSL